MVNLRQLINSKLAGIAEQWQEIIDPGAKQGQTIEIESRRQKIELSKAAYPAPDRDACIMEMDSPLESLPVKYGNHIPVDHAYKIMQDLEAGLGYTPDERTERRM